MRTTGHRDLSSRADFNNKQALRLENCVMDCFALIFHMALRVKS